MRWPYRAWLHVFHRPWFDVTTLSTRGTIPPGGFELRAVPAGDHIVLCWHEPVGRELDPLTASRVGPHSYRPEIRIARTLRVEAGGVATVDFEIDVGDRRRGPHLGGAPARAEAARDRLGRRRVGATLAGNTPAGATKMPRTPHVSFVLATAASLGAFALFAAPAPAAGKAYKVVEVKDGGTIRGFVRMTEVPSLAKLEIF